MSVSAQAASPAASQGSAMMAQVLSLSDRVASLTAERPGRSARRADVATAASRVGCQTGQQQRFTGASPSGERGSRPGSCERSLARSSGGPQHGMSDGGAPQAGPSPPGEHRRSGRHAELHGGIGRSGVPGELFAAAISSGGDTVWSPGMRAWAGRQGLGTARGGCPALVEPLGSPPARGAGAAQRGRSATAARRMLDHLGLGHGAGQGTSVPRCMPAEPARPDVGAGFLRTAPAKPLAPTFAAALHSGTLNPKPLPARTAADRGAAQVAPLRPGPASPAHAVDSVSVSAEQEGAGAGGLAGPWSGAHCGGPRADPLSVVHIFATQLAARAATAAEGGGPGTHGRQGTAAAAAATGPPTTSVAPEAAMHATAAPAAARWGADAAEARAVPALFTAAVDGEAHTAELGAADGGAAAAQVLPGRPVSGSAGEPRSAAADAGARSNASGAAGSGAAAGSVQPRAAIKTLVTLGRPLRGPAQARLRGALPRLLAWLEEAREPDQALGPDQDCTPVHAVTPFQALQAHEPDQVLMPDQGPGINLTHKPSQVQARVPDQARAPRESPGPFRAGTVSQVEVHEPGQRVGLDSDGARDRAHCLPDQARETAAPKAPPEVSARSSIGAAPGAAASASPTQPAAGAAARARQAGAEGSERSMSPDQAREAAAPDAAEALPAAASPASAGSTYGPDTGGAPAPASAVQLPAAIYGPVQPCTAVTASLIEESVSGPVGGPPAPASAVQPPAASPGPVQLPTAGVASPPREQGALGSACRGMPDQAREAAAPEQPPEPTWEEGIGGSRLASSPAASVAEEWLPDSAAAQPVLWGSASSPPARADAEQSPQAEALPPRSPDAQPAHGESPTASPAAAPGRAPLPGRAAAQPAPVRASSMPPSLGVVNSLDAGEDALLRASFSPAKLAAEGAASPTAAALAAMSSIDAGERALLRAGCGPTKPAAAAPAAGGMADVAADVSVANPAQDAPAGLADAAAHFTLCAPCHDMNTGDACVAMGVSFEMPVQDGASDVRQESPAILSPEKPQDVGIAGPASDAAASAHAAGTSAAGDTLDLEGEIQGGLHAVQAALRPLRIPLSRAAMAGSVTECPTGRPCPSPAMDSPPAGLLTSSQAGGPLPADAAGRAGNPSCKPSFTRDPSCESGALLDAKRIADAPLDDSARLLPAAHPAHGSASLDSSLLSGRADAAAAALLEDLLGDAIGDIVDAAVEALAAAEGTASKPDLELPPAERSIPNSGIPRLYPSVATAPGAHAGGLRNPWAPSAGGDGDVAGSRVGHRVTPSWEMECGVAPHAPALLTSFPTARSAADASAASAAGLVCHSGMGEAANLDMRRTPHQAEPDQDLAAMDLLSTESGAWLRADEDAGPARPAADTLRGTSAWHS